MESSTPLSSTAQKAAAATAASMTHAICTIGTLSKQAAVTLGEVPYQLGSLFGVSQTATCYTPAISATHSNLHISRAASPDKSWLEVQSRGYQFEDHSAKIGALLAEAQLDDTPTGGDDSPFSPYNEVAIHAPTDASSNVDYASALNDSLPPLHTFTSGTGDSPSASTLSSSSPTKQKSPDNLPLSDSDIALLNSTILSSSSSSPTHRIEYDSVPNSLPKSLSPLIEDPLEEAVSPETDPRKHLTVNTNLHSSLNTSLITPHLNSSQSSGGGSTHSHLSKSVELHCSSDFLRAVSDTLKKGTPGNVIKRSLTNAKAFAELADDEHAYEEAARSQCSAHSQSQSLDGLHTSQGSLLKEDQSHSSMLDSATSELDALSQSVLAKTLSTEEIHLKLQEIKGILISRKPQTPL